MHRIEDSVVILGGGGLFGAAWMTGIITGLAAQSIDLTKARAYIGTSAGAIVGSQVAHGYSPAELFARQTDPAKQPRLAPPSNSGLAHLTTLIQRQWDSPEARTRAIADLALRADTIDEAQRKLDVVERMGVRSNEWPERSLLVTAVDTESCALCVFNAHGGVGLIEAVAASTALAAVWPPTTIKGRRYMDGGLWRTPDNAHLAHGENLVLIVSPFGSRMTDQLDRDIEGLRQSGSRVALIAADDEAHSTLGLRGPLDPSIRAAAAEAGCAQAHRDIEKIRIWLG